MDRERRIQSQMEQLGREEKEKHTQSQDAKIQEIETLVELSIDDAARGRNAEQWGSPCAKSIICEVGKLEEIRKKFGDTNEGRLLKGLEKTEEILFSAVNTYIYERSRKVFEGLAKAADDIYQELEEHAEEVHAFF